MHTLTYEQYVALESEWRAFGGLDPLVGRVFALSAGADTRRHLATLAALVEAAPR